MPGVHGEAVFPVSGGKKRNAGGPAPDPVRHRRLSQFRFPLQRVNIVISAGSENFPRRSRGWMSQIITNRVRTSRRALLKGITAAGARIVDWPSATGVDVQFRRDRLCGHAAPASRRKPGGKADRNPFCSVVQRERHSGALLDSHGRRKRLRTDAVPGSAGRLAQGRSRAERRGQRGRQRQRQRPHELDERFDDRPGFHRPRTERAVDRPDYCGEDRRRFALPLAADRRGAGIVRREHAAQHELGGIRAGAAAGDDSAPAV